MNAYQKSTRPLIEFYRRRGLLISIPAQGSAEEVFKRTLAAINGAVDAQTGKGV
jgi:adenylate kinase family enzyme